MEITMSFKNVKHSKRLEKTVEEKTKRIKKFFNGQTSMTWSFSKGDRGVLIDAYISGPTFHYHAHSKTDNIYKGVEQTVSKITRQVKKKKEIMRNKIHQRGSLKKTNVLQFQTTQDRKVEHQETFYQEDMKKAA